MTRPALGRTWTLSEKAEQVKLYAQKCISRMGVERAKHERDRDDRCVFCDQRLQPLRREEGD
jgi:hypothetical protein